MIRKAYVVELVGNQAKVRIPFYHGMPTAVSHEPDDLLPMATIAGNKALKNSIAVGDVVYVAFEGDDLGRPVIIGTLELPPTDSEEDDNSNLTQGNFKNLTVSGITRLAESTSIGDVSATEIKYLDGVKKPIQDQFDSITNTTADYKTKYYTKEYNRLDKWRLDPRGVILDVDLLDDTASKVDTVEHTSSLKAEASILSNETAHKHTNIDGTTEEWKFTEGYNVDARQRLNWMGILGVKNDTVKYQSGLFSRNWWDITSTANDSGEKCVKSEYTYRPAIQSYVLKSRGLSNVEPITNKSNEQQNYSDEYLPFNMLINPEGGDTHIGRGSNGVVVYDNDGLQDKNLPRSGLRLTAKAYKDGDGNTVNGGDILIQVKDGQLYQTDLNTHKESKVGSGAGGGATYFTVASGTDKYVNAYVHFGDSEHYSASGLYGMFDDEDQLMSGNLTFRATVALVLQTTNLGTGDTTQDVMPVSAQAFLQLGSIKEYLMNYIATGENRSGIIVDLTTSLGWNWDNMYFHFMFRIKPVYKSGADASHIASDIINFDKENDLIQFDIENVGNYITEVELKSQIITFSRASLVTTVFYDNGKLYTTRSGEAGAYVYSDELPNYTELTVSGTSGSFKLGGNTYSITDNTAQIPATINLSVEYNGVGVEGVKTSTIEIYDQNNIGGTDDYE